MCVVSTHSQPQLPFKAILGLSPPQCFKIPLECVAMQKDSREAIESEYVWISSGMCLHQSYAF